MIDATAKVLILGPPEGSQGLFVSEIGQMKIRSTTRNPSSEEVIPMHFGKVRLAEGLDLQLFATERDRGRAVIDALSPGLLGSILLVDWKDVGDPHFVAETLDLLAQAGISCVVACDPSVKDAEALELALGLKPSSTIRLSSWDKDQIKNVLITLLESVIGGAQGSAA